MVRLTERGLDECQKPKHDWAPPAVVIIAAVGYQFYQQE